MNPACEPVQSSIREVLGLLLRNLGRKGQCRLRVETLKWHASPSSDRDFSPNVHDSQNRVVESRDGLVQEAHLWRATNIIGLGIGCPRIETGRISRAIYSEKPALRSGLHQPI
jgi:hypothetical protein